MATENKDKRYILWSNYGSEGWQICFETDSIDELKQTILGHCTGNVVLPTIRLDINLTHGVK